ncbi:MAG: hypothetical protein VKP63_00160 [Cyanobacteriota bacterium]|nr:hypothetical protein [Cyanobacteriota bacterium]
MLSPRRHRRSHPLWPPTALSRQEFAYLMPLAAVVSGCLLLLGLTVQAMALQERSRSSAMERLRREDDLLVSAAHQLLAVLNNTHPCLLSLPHTEWGLRATACASPPDVDSLTRLEVWSVPVRVQAWTPGADGGNAELTVQLQAGQGRAPRRGRFTVRLMGSPPQAVDLRSLGAGEEP